MISSCHDFAVIGGDLRQEYIISNLIESGFSVIVYGLNAPLSHKSLTIGESLVDVMNCDPISFN